MAQSMKSRPSKETGNRQLDGALRHAAHLAEMRAMILGTEHGTDKSKRGRRKRTGK